MTVGERTCMVQGFLHCGAHFFHEYFAFPSVCTWINNLKCSLCKLYIKFRCHVTEKRAVSIGLQHWGLGSIPGQYVLVFVVGKVTRSVFPCQYHSTIAAYSYFIHLPSTLCNLIIGSVISVKDTPFFATHTYAQAHTPTHRDITGFPHSRRPSGSAPSPPLECRSLWPVRSSNPRHPSNHIFISKGSEASCTIRWIWQLHALQYPSPNGRRHGFGAKTVSHNFVWTYSIA